MPVTVRLTLVVEYVLVLVTCCVDTDANDTVITLVSLVVVTLVSLVIVAVVVSTVDVAVVDSTVPVNVSLIDVDVVVNKAVLTDVNVVTVLVCDVLVAS